MQSHSCDWLRSGSEKSGGIVLRYRILGPPGGGGAAFYFPIRTRKNGMVRSTLAPSSPKNRLNSVFVSGVQRYSCEWLKPGRKRKDRGYPPCRSILDQGGSLYSAGWIVLRYGLERPVII